MPSLALPQLVDLALAVILAILFRELAVETLRHRLFRIRNELFLYWADSGLPFDHPAYVGLRYVFNSGIRFAHRMTPLRLFPVFLYMMMAGVRRESILDPIRDLERRLGQVPDPETRKQLLTFFEQAMRDMGIFLLSGSLSGWVLFALLCLVMVSKLVIARSSHVARIIRVYLAKEAAYCGRGAQVVALCSESENM